MNIALRAGALGAFAFGALSSTAFATSLPFSTGFEANEGYTNGTELVTNSNWNGDGQDTSGWLVTNQSIGGSGPKSGSQWVLTSGATASITKFQWTVTPVTDFSSNPIINGSSDVKLVSPASGTVNRNTAVGVAMYDANIIAICDLVLIIDSENLSGLGAGRMLAELDFGDGTGVAYDLGVANQLNVYVNLGLSVNFTTGTVTGYVNGTALPDVGSTGGATDFHDFDLLLGSASTTVAGTRARGGFDNYSVSQTPEPATLSMLALALAFKVARRGR